ncbi:ArsA family ATPase [bacterium]|nr:ArsA family ATPase [bacterium]
METEHQASLWELLQNKKIILFVGTGGVGKTTVSAATALAAAKRGKKVLVITIDPARRLANAMGLQELGNVETRISFEGHQDEPRSHGELWAMMLDVKRALDELIIKYAPTEEIANRILSNTIYKAVSDSLAGTEEIVALGKLYELHKQGKYDLFIVDTAPTKHALDFFESPARLMNLLDISIIKWFLKPLDLVHRISFRTLNRSTSFLIERVEKSIGLSFFTEIASFLQNFEGMFEALKERAHQINTVLHDPNKTALIIVTGTDPSKIATTNVLIQKLKELAMPPQWIVLNRVHPIQTLTNEHKQLVHGFVFTDRNHQEVIEKLKECQTRLSYPIDHYFNLIHHLLKQTLTDAEHDEQVVAELSDRFPNRCVSIIPTFDFDISDLTGLHRLTDYLIREERA